VSQDSTAQDSQFESDGRLTVGTDDCLIDEAWGEDAEISVAEFLAADET